MERNYFYFVFGARWPMLLLALIGIVVALWRRRLHPKASLLTVLALVLFLVQSPTFGTIFYFLPRLSARGFTYSAINPLYIIIEVCHDIVFTPVIILLVSAVLSQRKPASA
jgi:hypothetical protein